MDVHKESLAVAYVAQE
jgi:transposase